MPAINTSQTVAVVGGGLGGLAAGCALADAGYRVTLFERRPYLGGRASSYQHPGTGEVVDNCQHVLLGCCTNLIDLYRRSGVENQIRWFDRLNFLEPGGRNSEIAIGALPAPLHTAPTFLTARALGFSDKLAIAKAMLELMGDVNDDGRSFLAWLRSRGQTECAISRFWAPVLVSALNENLENCSIRYGALVFRESFLKSVEAGRMGIPAIPLSELYSAAGDYIRERGGEVNLRAAVESFAAGDSGVVLGVSGQEVKADYAVLAVPFNTVANLLPGDNVGAAIREMAGHFESSPITGIHLWFDRQITTLEHAVLLDRTIQWMFHKSKLLNRDGSGSYVELVVSASKSLVEMGRQEIIDLAVKELGEFLPLVREAKLEKATVIKEVHATYSPKPGVDEYRPKAQTGWPRIVLAGDWTDTGWPATMEGAVRSGYLAAEALTGKQFLVPDLPASGLMKLFC
ncbi:MAG TPA: hydroxysqualene dehydroxylase HpnE [Terriglobales bacterium]|nr:hydroxysqualene dehydroxylase HpnE [Terriglobales bacterium]